MTDTDAPQMTNCYFSFVTPLEVGIGEVFSQVQGLSCGECPEHVDSLHVDGWRFIRDEDTIWWAWCPDHWPTPDPARTVFGRMWIYRIPGARRLASRIMTRRVYETISQRSIW